MDYEKRKQAIKTSIKMIDIMRISVPEQFDEFWKGNGKKDKEGIKRTLIQFWRMLKIDRLPDEIKSNPESMEYIKSIPADLIDFVDSLQDRSRWTIANRAMDKYIYVPVCPENSIDVPDITVHYNLDKACLPAPTESRKCTKKDEKRAYYEDRKSELEGKLNNTLDNALQNPEALKRLTDHYKVKGLYNYSFLNNILIMVQGGEVVNSYKNWLAMGRQVRKGEKASIYVWHPAIAYKYTCKSCSKVFLNAKDRDSHKKTAGHTSFDKQSRFSGKFFLSPVFDIKQTDGKELEYIHNSDKIDIDYNTVKDKAVKGFGVDIYEHNLSSARGYFEGERTIVISKQSNNADRINTLIHEIAHYYMKHEGRKPEQELEAEGVTLIVTSFLDMDTELSESYIQSWKTGDAVDKINRKKIISTADKIIKTLFKETIGQQYTKSETREEQVA